jgi:hypothetical protein
MSNFSELLSFRRHLIGEMPASSYFRQSIRGTRGARSCSPRLEELTGHLAAFKGLLSASRKNSPI